MARLRVTYGGILAGAQRWSIGFSFRRPGSAFGSQSALNDLAVQLFADFNTAAWSTTATGAKALRQLLGTQGNLDQCRVYAYDDATPNAVGVGVSNQAAVAGLNTPAIPPQIAIVATLVTPSPARSGRGRVYLPNMVVGCNATGVFDIPTAQGIALSIANYLSLARSRTWESGTITPIVDSSTAADTDITAVRVDNVMDTQRRRRDKIVATARAQSSLVTP